MDLPDGGGTKDRILEAGLRLFGTRGYEGVGVQEVAEFAGITKPSLYHHFGSKRGLLEGIFEVKATPLCQEVAKACVYEKDAKRSLETLAQAMGQYARGQSDFYRLLLALWFAPPDSEAHDVSRQWNAKLFESVESLFVSMAGQHGNMKGRHSAYAASFLGMVNTMIGLALNGYREFEGEALRSAVKYFMHGIFS
ncbi:MAG TPA: TetR/AcrR family transcriptional regulator [Rectinemataceae bacterium]|nr:TetR/AcrR family transcriptional regulator [Rectinemataceae bacterium]